MKKSGIDKVKACHVKPTQLLKNSEKDEKWYEWNAWYWNQIIPFVDYDRFRVSIEKACGIINKAGYSFVTNPYNEGNGGKTRNMPAQLKNYDIISPILLQLQGEFLDRVLEFIVYNKNSDVHNEKLKLEHQLRTQQLQQMFINFLIQYGLYVPGQTDEQGQPIQPPISEELINQEVSNLVDEKGKNGQIKLDYIWNTKDVPRVIQDLFLFFIYTGETFSFKDIINDDIYYKVIRPKKFGYIKSEDTIFIEDAEATKFESRHSFADLVEMFDQFEEFNEIRDEIQAAGLTGISKYPSETRTFMDDFLRNSNFNNDSANGYSLNRNSLHRPVDEHIVCHIQWKTLTYMYRVRYVEPSTGEISFVDYDDEYIPLEGEDYEKRVCAEKHEVFIIDGIHVLGGRPLQHARADYNNPMIARGSYNGICIQPILDGALSIPDKLDPYQENYNIVKYVIQKTINKNKDKIATIPLSLVNKGFKRDEVVINRNEKEDLENGVIDSIEVRKKSSPIAESLYFADATQFLFVDDIDMEYEQAQVAATLMKSIDLSLGNYIQYLYQYAALIREEANELVGFNRYRRAATSERDAVGNMQQGQYTGSLITESYFETFRQFIEREGLGLLDLGKFLYNEGLVGEYLNSSYERISVNIPEGALSYSNLGIVVKSGGRVKQDFDLLKQNIQNFIQNGATPSLIGKLAKSNNFDSLVDELEKEEKKMAQSTQAAQEALNAIEERKLDLEERRLALEKYAIDMKYKASSEALVLKNEEGKNKDETLDYLKEYNASRQKETEDLFRLAEVKLKEGEQATKRYVVDKQFDIAKENKSQ